MEYIIKKISTKEKLPEYSHDCIVWGKDDRGIYVAQYRNGEWILSGYTNNDLSIEVGCWAYFPENMLIDKNHLKEIMFYYNEDKMFKELINLIPIDKRHEAIQKVKNRVNYYFYDYIDRYIYGGLGNSKFLDIE